ncbi:receptor-like protein EIX1 [Pyrus x bretschneideri]|uniref:receptor-like protein EIX1 n=1 Tax=Pyrus x bretschneideri TaxID=225117 RepID=UPI00202E5E35|nr:receptor-like protein EIX1 [Pyrus x bretschneideri]
MTMFILFHTLNIADILRPANSIPLLAHIRSMVHRSASVQLFSLIVLSGFLFFETTKLGFCSADLNVGCKETQRKALLELKAGLTDPSDRLLSWVGEDCCQWSGVGCNYVTGRVTKLNLRNEFFDGEDGTAHEFGGEINPSLLVLNDLIHLDLSMKNFKCVQIPSFIGSLEKLEYLNLSSASFGGVIPHNLGNLSRLLSLDLSYYNFELVANEICWLAPLSSLKYLNLGGVNLSKANSNWLPTVNMLPSLVELHLPSCGLSVLPLTLPSMNFASLSVLDLSYNDFNSTLPPWLFSLTKLVTLEMHSTSLHGALPETFGSLTSLRMLDLSENSNIEGQLPRSLGTLCSLQTVILPINKFTGEITDFVDSLSTCTNSRLEISQPERKTA